MGPCLGLVVGKLWIVGIQGRICLLLTLSLTGFAGIGRTGTFCTVDIALRRLRALKNVGATPAVAKQAVDIKQIVQRLRRQRQGMVQTKSQYVFCHEVIVVPSMIQIVCRQADQILSCQSLYCFQILKFCRVRDSFESFQDATKETK